MRGSTRGRYFLRHARSPVEEALRTSLCVRVSLALRREVRQEEVLGYGVVGGLVMLIEERWLLLSEKLSRVLERDVVVVEGVSGAKISW